MSALLAALALLGGEPRVTAEIIAPVKVSDGGPIVYAVAVTPQMGWHVYWKNPGDSGVPLSIKWDLPAGWKSDPLQFPAPKKFSVGDALNYGFDTKVELTGVLQPPSNSAKGAYRISGSLSWMACDEEACEAGELDIELQGSLGTSTELDSKADEAYNRASRAIPSKPAKGTATFTKDRYVVEVEGIEPGGAYFYCESEGTILHQAEQKVTKAGERARFELPISPFAKKPVERLRGVLVTGAPGSQAALRVDFPVHVSTIGTR